MYGESTWTDKILGIVFVLFLAFVFLAMVAMIVAMAIKVVSMTLEEDEFVQWRKTAEKKCFVAGGEFDKLRNIVRCVKRDGTIEVKEYKFD